jgi:alpha-L-rhamnosidase
MGLGFIFHVSSAGAETTASTGSTLAADQLESDFVQPPNQTRPWCYWYWISDNVSREGITHDLEAMARVGIGEAMIAHVAGRDTPLGNVKLMSETWWSLLEHAIREGRRLGVDIGVFNGPGWSQSGGPWITPARAMRYVVSSETRVKGPMKFEGKLPIPQEPFQNIAVLAFPAPRADMDTISKRSPRISCIPAVAHPERLVDGDLKTDCLFPVGVTEGKKPLVVDIELAEQFTARSLALHPIEGNVYARCELQAEDAGGVFRPVQTFLMDRRGLDRPKFRLIVGPMVTGPVVVSFAPVTSRHFRLVITDLIGTGGLTEINLSAAARLDHFVEKQLGKMHPTPMPEWNSYIWPPSMEPDSADLGVAPSQIHNLSDKLQSDGTLRWDVPEGEWIILNSGMTPTGVTNHPTTDEGRGLECDKMSPAAVEQHFNNFVGKLLQLMPEADRSALRHVVVDSYEVASENWTDDFRKRFQTTFGYDPQPWLPVLTGRIVGSAGQSDRFLWDLRRLVADLIATNYIGGLRDLSNRHGLQLLMQPYGHWGFPAEFLQYGGQSNDVSGEFWVRSDQFNYKNLESTEVRASSSSAHLYGKQVVIAEAFTSDRSFRDSPASIKTLGDWAFTHGVNHFMLHVYIHQPWDDKVPGVNAWFGTEFNRHNTWFEQSKSWIDYLRRCHVLLQQGRGTADVAYFIGEDAPIMSGPRQPNQPAGYDYDFINAEVLLNRVRVEHGLLKVPDGPSYGLLVLPPLETMRPELLRKIRDLVAEGAAILGSPPKRSPSLQNYPQSDQEVKKLAAELWGELEHHQGPGLAERAFGKGRVFCGEDMVDVLHRRGIEPKISCPEDVLWTLRKTENADIYFLSNQSDRPQSAEISFRVSGLSPEFWYPDTGKIESAAWFSPGDGCTRVPITLDQHGSMFVVFRKPVVTPPVVKITKDGRELKDQAGASPIRVTRRDAGELVATISEPGHYVFQQAGGRESVWNVPEFPAAIALTGPWQLRLPSVLGGVPKEVELPQLISWSASSDDSIRYFSGTGTYQIKTILPDELFTPGRRLLLDLGHLEVIAEVRVNGKNLGCLWNRPFVVDITDAASPGSNLIEIMVTNNWWNRLTGDEKLPPDQRKTFTAWKPPSPRTTLQPSGLLGPVRILNVTVGRVDFQIPSIP